MKDMITVFVHKDGQDTNGRFQTEFKAFVTDDIITFCNTDFKVTAANRVAVIAEEIEN